MRLFVSQLVHRVQGGTLIIKAGDELVLHPLEHRRSLSESETEDGITYSTAEVCCSAPSCLDVAPDYCSADSGTQH